MNIHQVIIIMLIILLTLLSGLADAQGFVHASTTWVNGQIIWAEGFKSLLAFGIGAICYLLAANFLKQAGIGLARNPNYHLVCGDNHRSSSH